MLRRRATITVDGAVRHVSKPQSSILILYIAKHSAPTRHAHTTTNSTPCLRLAHEPTSVGSSFRSCARCLSLRVFFLFCLFVVRADRSKHHAKTSHLRGFTVGVVCTGAQDCREFPGVVHRRDGIWVRRQRIPQGDPKFYVPGR